MHESNLCAIMYHMKIEIFDFTPEGIRLPSSLLENPATLQEFVQEQCVGQGYRLTPEGYTVHDESLPYDVQVTKKGRRGALVVLAPKNEDARGYTIGEKQNKQVQLLFGRREIHIPQQTRGLSIIGGSVGSNEKKLCGVVIAKEDNTDRLRRVGLQVLYFASGGIIKPS